MSFTRVVSPGIACKACRAAIARSSPAIPVNGLTTHASWTTSFASPQRSFTAATDRRADKHNPATEDPEFAFLDKNDGTSTTSPKPDSTPVEPTQQQPTPTPPEPSQSAPLPWYLQNRPTPTPQQPALIPDLPPNPPPLLPTLLDYISTTAGLDDLTLFDLRNLDPPPALGPKLIMVLATARSEKHLHVSADRFCRYLRREHKLRANAAGLLGRNELKIKLRRKAKRMKMLANVGGATEIQGNLDDGIRTGWICCTVGKIEAHPEDSEMPGDNVKEFVGFREVKPGVNVVVQMFTEEKRAEIDLEALWGGILRTHERKDRNAEEALKQLEEDANEDEAQVQIQAGRDAEHAAQQVTQRADTPPPAPRTAPSPTHQFTKPRPTTGDVFPPASPSRPPFDQIRRLHTIGLRP
ncbi:hypothetical protein BU26DRAFT_525518 [Trematosphaeria pertusa]|uniref:ATPase synthesis protein 25 n=1 Tax=Trematosphaeria pertusa TaxID=390896 RepID=A0A6A6HS85_9PLEO|nr:uncharacterized protein BU26DRAFT_525518 [Trematosphaeria pertusa]KAF2240976.1 hypothetical protein BU26DRAFT_525518 [Trematosphaeria pertusa]